MSNWQLSILAQVFTSVEEKFSSFYVPIMLKSGGDLINYRFSLGRAFQIEVGDMLAWYYKIPFKWIRKFISYIAYTAH